jgi:hypothetical protein
MNEEINVDGLLAELETLETQSGLDHVSSEFETNGDINTVGGGYEIISFGLPSIADPKEYKTFIRKCEAMIRTSNEYSKYISYLKGMLNINRCSIFGNITSEHASIEMHHYPFNLYEICEHTAEKLFSQNIPVTTFAISDEVMKLHYDNMIGLVPLSVTAHELAHKGQIAINMLQVFGNVKEYIHDFKDFISQDSIDNISAIEDYTSKNTLINENSNFLTITEVTANDTASFDINDINSLNLIVTAESPVDDRKLARFKK